MDERLDANKVAGPGTVIRGGEWYSNLVEGKEGNGYACCLFFLFFLFVVCVVCNMQHVICKR